MKRILLLLVLAAVIAGGVSAQSDFKRHWASGEVSLLGIGARYEFMLNPKWSVGGNFYWNNMFFFLNDWGVAATGRFYPWGKMFHIELGLGFSNHRGIGDYSYTYNNIEYSYSKEWIKVVGVGIIPGIGWKIDPGKKGGFFISPGIKVPITLGKKTAIIDWWYDGHDPGGEFGAGFNVIVYCGFGGAF